ncbi:MFS transporter [Paenibacillus sp. KN14-4R]|uniref:MFS transporter n=1 Tax=Paenibacillus sp. KN14-4R TaxID=3445773 RepID=UPI003FA1008B
MLELLIKNGKFRSLLLSSLISQLGSFFTFMLLIVMTFERTQSLISTMGVTLASTLGSIVAGLAGGFWVEQRSPAKVMVMTNLLSASVLIGMFFLPTTMTYYYITAFLIAVFGAFSRPASSKLQVMLVPSEQLMASNASRQMLNEVVRVFGPGLAVFVLTLLPKDLSTVGFLIDGVSYLIAAVLLYSIGTFDKTSASDKGKSPTVKVPFVTRLKEGVEPLRAPVILAILGMFFFCIIGITGFDVILTAHISRSGLPSIYSGYVISALSAGLIVASFFSKYFSKLSLAIRLGLSVFGMGLGLLCLGLTANLYIMLGFAFIIGVFNVIYNISASTYMQQNIPLEKMGRAQGFTSSFFSTVGLLGMGVSALIGELLSPATTFLIMGGAIALSGFISVFTIHSATKRQQEIGQAQAVNM